MIGRTVLGGRPVPKMQQSEDESNDIYHEVDLDKDDQEILPVISNEGGKKTASALLHTILDHYQSTMAKVPPRYKYLCFFLWVAWKFVAVFLVYYVFQGTGPSTQIPWVPLPQTFHSQSPKVRILYVVTSSINVTEVMDSTSIVVNNKRQRRQRISEQLAKSIPLVKYNVANMTNAGYHVDVVWLHEDGDFPMSADLIDGNEEAPDYYSQFHRQAREALPRDVGLSFWPHASSLQMDSTTGRLVSPSNLHTNLIQRQALRILRDAFPMYHLFLVWPDVARIRDTTVNHFWNISQHAEKGFVPAVLPVINAIDLDANSTFTKGRIKLRGAEKMVTTTSRSLFDTASAKLMTNFSLQDLKTKVLVPNALQSQVTIQLPQNYLWRSYGFMLTRSQLALENGLLEKCLADPSSLPISWPKKAASENPCMLSSQGIVVADKLLNHLVEFENNPFRSSSTGQQHEDLLVFIEKLNKLMPNLELKDERAIR